MLINLFIRFGYIRCYIELDFILQSSLSETSYPCNNMNLTSLCMIVMANAAIYLPGRYGADLGDNTGKWNIETIIRSAYYKAAAR